MSLFRLASRLATLLLALACAGAASAASLTLRESIPVLMEAGASTVGVQVRVSGSAANPSAVLAIALPGRCSQMLSQIGGVDQAVGTTIPAGTTVFRLIDNYQTFNGCGDGQELARLDVLAQPAQSVPAPPAWVQHSASEPDPQSVRVRWAESVGASQYGVEWKRQDCPNWIGGAAITGSTTPNVPNERHHTTALTHGMWAARVRARNDWGWSGYRAAASAPLFTAVGTGNPAGIACPEAGGSGGGGTPGTPTLTASPSTVSIPQGQTQGSISLAWNAAGSQGALYQESPQGRAAVSYQPAGSLSFPIVAGTTRYLLVRDVATYLGGGQTYNGQPNLLAQASASAHRLGERPLPPQALNLPASTVGNALDLSWTPVTGAAHYRLAVQRNSCPSRWEITRAPPESGPLLLTGTSYRTDARAVPGNGSYYFFVSACNDWGCSDWTVAPAMAPAQVTGLVGSSNSPVCPGGAAYTMPSGAFIHFTPARVLVPRPAVSGGVNVLAGVPRNPDGSSLSTWQGAVVSIEHRVAEQFLTYVAPYQRFGAEVFVDTPTVLRMYLDQTHVGAASAIQLVQTVRAYQVPGAISSLVVPQESPSCRFNVQWTASEGASHYQLQLRYGDASQPWQPLRDNLLERIADVDLPAVPAGNPPVFLRVRGCDQQAACQADDTEESRWRTAGPIQLSSTAAASCAGGGPASGDVQALPEVLVLEAGVQSGRSTIRWLSNNASGPELVREERNLQNQLVSTTTLSASASGELSETIRIDRRYRFLLQHRVQGNAVVLDSVEVRAETAPAAAELDWLDSDPKPAPIPVAVQVPAAEVGAVEVGTSAGSFRVDESGGANYQLPIYTAPATGGIAPQFALAYSSNAGDGHLGVGWQLSGLSSITRCRKTRESGDGPGPHPQVDFSEADAFCLDGQRLIPTGSGSDARGSFTGYRTEIDNFAVIRAYTASGIVGPAWWAAWGKDGLQRVYGLPAGGGIYPCSSANACAGRLMRNIDGVPDNTRVMIWALSKIRSRDAATGVIEFNYDFDQAGGEYAITRVAYSGAEQPIQGRSVLPTAAIEFEYGTPRAAPKLHYSAGARVSTTRYLATITSRNADNQVVRRYTLRYGSNAASGLRQIESIRECAADGTCLAPTDFLWSRHSNRIEGADYLMGQNPYRRLVDAKFGDVDGDGRNDMVWTEGPSDRDQTVIVSRTTAGPGTVTFDRVTTPRRLIDAFDNDRGWHLFDYNQDGRDDLLIAECAGSGCATASWNIYLANGSSQVFESTRLPIASIPVARGNSDWTTDAILADFTGDGLVDFAVPAATQSGAPVVLKVHALRRAAERNGLCVMNGVASTCPYEFDEGRALEISVPQFSLRHYDYDQYEATDVNGDGLADLQLKYLSGLSSGRATTVGQMVRDPARSGASGTDVASEMPSGSNWRWGVFINRGPAAARWRFDLGNSWDETQVYNEPSAFRFTDINGDGLADVAYAARPRTTGGLGVVEDRAWLYALNRGDGSYTEDRCVHRGRNNQCEYIDNRSTVRLQDFDADGDVDFWVALEESHGNTTIAEACRYEHQQQPYVVLRWRGDSFEQAPLCRSDVGALNHGETDRNYFVDLDGDGQLDALRIAEDGRYYVARRDYLPAIGQGSPLSARFVARHVITDIVSGLYAQTRIDYAPMSFGSVYQRDYDAPHRRSSGRGAPVMDLDGPSYLVHRVGSSAPIDGNPAAMSYVSYRYVGAKVQGGGRGALGMRKVYSFDEQTQVLSMSEYHQDWPLAGRPLRSESRRIGGSFPQACSGGEICVSRAPVCNSSTGQPDPTLSCDQFALAGTVLGSASDGWTYRSSAATRGAQTAALPAEPAYVFVYQTSSSKLAHACATSDTNADACSGSAVLKRELTRFTDYDTAGNLLDSSAEVYDSADRLLQRVASNFQYSPPSWSDPWIGGLLARSTVTTTRGSDSRVRVSAYDYSGDGTLRAEHLQPEGAPNERLSTYHVRNNAGIVRLKAVCSSHYSEAQCVAADEQGGVLVPRAVPARPADPLAIRRVESYRHDPSFRFVDGSWTGFDVGGEYLEFREAATIVDADRNGSGDRSPTGEAFATVDANGIVSQSRYTPMGNKYFEFIVGSQAAKTQRYRWCSGSQPAGASGMVACPAGAAYRLELSTAGAPTSWVWYDKLGREILKASQGFRAEDISHVRVGYDRLGRTVNTSEPYFAPLGTRSACGGSVYCSLVQYDFLGRSVRVDLPDHTLARPVQARTRYSIDVCSGANCSLQTATNARLNPHKQWTSALGEVVQVEDALGLRVEYSFDALGNTTRVRRIVEGRVIDNLASFDHMSRRLSATDEDYGTRIQSYNALGESIEERNASQRDGQCTRTRYDGRGRPWRRTDYRSATCVGEPEADSEWTFDRSGRYGILTAEREYVSGLVRSFSHDALMRVTATDATLDGRSYRQESTYDAYSRAFQQFDLVFAAGTPEAISSTRARRIGVEFEYNAQGFQQRVVNAQDAADVLYEVYAVDARGKVRSARRGNTAALASEIGYDAASGRLVSIRSGVNGALQSLDYTDYDANGNLGTRIDNKLGARETFVYDALDRLTQSTVQLGQAVVPTVMQYDALGNFRSKGGETYVNGSYTGVANSCARTVLGPHLVARMAGTTYCWDDNGNQVSAGDGNPQSSAPNQRFLSYTVNNQPSRIRVTGTTHGTVDYRYGPSRELIKRIDTSSIATQNDTVHYLAGVEVFLLPDSGQDTQRREYRRTVAGVMQVTMRTSVSGGALRKSSERRFLFKDKLGSTDVIAAPDGSVTQRMSFDVWGQRRNASDWRALGGEAIQNFDSSITRKGYTGHEGVDIGNLVHMGGRIYDPRMARFLSADPIVQAPFNTQSLNRYSYVLNNPMNYVDPTGYSWLSDNWRSIASIAVIAFMPQAYAFLGIVEGLGTTIVTGMISGAVQSGSLKGALMGGLSAGMFFGVGSYFERAGVANIKAAGGKFDGVFGTNLKAGQFAAKVGAHAATGGVMSVLQGGKFGHGALSAGFNAALSPAIDLAPNKTDLMISAVVGGTGSVLAGGKFANGAVTAAFGRAFNEWRHGVEEYWAEELPPLEGVRAKIAIALEKGGQGVEVDTDGGVDVSLLQLGKARVISSVTKDGQAKVGVKLRRDLVKSRWVNVSGYGEVGVVGSEPYLSAGVTAGGCLMGGCLEISAEVSPIQVIKSGWNRGPVNYRNTVRGLSNLNETVVKSQDGRVMVTQSWMERAFESFR